MVFCFVLPSFNNKTFIHPNLRAKSINVAEENEVFSWINCSCAREVLLFEVAKTYHINSSYVKHHHRLLASSLFFLTYLFIAANKCPRWHFKMTVSRALFVVKTFVRVEWRWRTSYESKRFHMFLHYDSCCAPR